MRKVLLSLWVFGAAIYTANSVVIADRLGLLGGVLGTSGAEQAAPAEIAQTQERVPAEEADTGEDSQLAEADEEENLFPEASEESGAWVRVARGARVRAGPSNAAPALGRIRADVALQVLRQENGWVEIYDPDAGEAGWVRGRYVNGDVQTVGSDLFEFERDGDRFADRGEWEFEEAERPQARTSSRRAQRRGATGGGVASHFYKQFGR